MSHFNVSLIVRAKSQDSVHRPQFLKRKESGSGSNRGPSAYQPSSLPLDHTGSLMAGLGRKHRALRPQKPLRLLRDREDGRGGGRDFFFI